MVLLKRKYAAVAAAISLAVCFAVSGCGNDGAEKAEIDVPCSFDAQITKADHSFAANFQRSDDGGWTVVFMSPESLSDMIVKSFGESRQIDYCGLVMELQSDSMPEGSIVTVVESCIDHAAKSSSAKFTKDGDATLIKGETSCGPYELRVSKSGELISLNVGTEICAEFSGFEKLS